MYEKQFSEHHPHEHEADDTQNEDRFLKRSSTLELIEKVVDARQMITVFYPEFVKFTIIDAHTESLVFLLYE